MAQVKTFLREQRKVILIVYMVLLAASHGFLAWKGEDLQEGAALQVECSDGVLAYHEWGERKGVPLILFHGSPSGGGGDFEKLGQFLSEDRWVIAPDRVGFGRSSKRATNLSFVTDAEASLQLMDALQIEEADVMGWSYGGGVVLEMVARYPTRVRSVGLLAAIGIQEGEGSGSYAIEHLKYELLRVVMMWLPEAIPHFGLAGSDWFRRSFVCDFADADQRPLRGILAQLDKPVLIVHGKDDPLVPAWVAEEHHELLSNSRLEILNASHFFPIGGEGMSESGEVVDDFLGVVSEGGEIRARNYQTHRKEMKAIWSDGPHLRGWKPWWLVLVLCGVAAWFCPRLTLFLVALGGAFLLWDGLVGAAGVLFVLWGRKLFKIPFKKRPTRWFAFCLLGDFIAGSVIGGLLLALT